MGTDVYFPCNNDLSTSIQAFRTFLQTLEHNVVLIASR